MIQKQETNDEVMLKLTQILSQPNSRWRTVRALAHGTSTTEPVVLRYLREHPDQFEVSPIAPSGIPLYGLRRGTDRDND